MNKELQKLLKQINDKKNAETVESNQRQKE